MISKMVVKYNHHKKKFTVLAIMPIQIVIKFDIYLFGRGIYFNDTIMKAIERTLIKNEIAKKIEGKKHKKRIIEKKVGQKKKNFFKTKNI